jgi:hypothetical protein
MVAGLGVVVGDSVGARTTGDKAIQGDTTARPSERLYTDVARAGTLKRLSESVDLGHAGKPHASPEPDIVKQI